MKLRYAILCILVATTVSWIIANSKEIPPSAGLGGLMIFIIPLFYGGAAIVVATAVFNFFENKFLRVFCVVALCIFLVCAGISLRNLV